MKENRLIPLTRGKFAIVDSVDYEWLMQWKWHASHDGYAVQKERSTDNPRKERRMHNEVARIAGFARSDYYDHRDLNGFNNTRENLRPCTRSQNAANCKKPITKNGQPSSKYKGVSWRKREKLWSAKISVIGKYIWLGCYKTEKEAVTSYVIAARKYFGEFARVDLYEGDTTKGGMVFGR